MICIKPSFHSKQPNSKRNRRCRTLTPGENWITRLSKQYYYELGNGHNASLYLEIC